MFVVARWYGNDYVFFAGYVVLQFIVLATAWNILGGYTGYVNFGSAAFFAVGAYTSVFFHKIFPLPIPVLIVIGGIVSGLIGLGMGYLTLRLRGAFFAIATLALAVVLQTIDRQLDLSRRRARRLSCIRPDEMPNSDRALHPIPVPADAGARGDRAVGRARHRALAARLRLRHHPRRRARGRGVRRADLAAEADRDHDLRRA